MTAKRSRRPVVAIDVGNSQIKAGLFDPLAVGEKSLSAPDRNVSLATDQWDPLKLALWLAPYRPCEVDWFIASVHDGAASELRGWLEQEEASARTHGITFEDIPLKIEVLEPASVGIDRLLGAVAVNRIRTDHRPAVVIDLGTAITVDVISAEGAFRGGVILPGIQMSARALHAFTDRLPEVSLSDEAVPESLIGQSTGTAISSGIYWGIVGALRTLLEELNCEMKQEPEVFVTGGHVERVVEALNFTLTHEPHLVLSGIACVADALGYVEEEG